MAIGNAVRTRIVRRRILTLLAACRPLVLFGLTALTAGCGGLNGIKEALFGGATTAGQPGIIKGFAGGVVADEPNAALVGRDILAAGGSAADAAASMGFTLSVSLPSRAGLGAGGACLAYTASRKGITGGVPEAVLFVSYAPTAAPGGMPAADRPAGMPMLARGMFLLQTRHGRLPFEMSIAPAERLARFGMPVSRAFARDLTLVAGPLLADTGARAVFAQDGALVREGQSVTQTDLAVTLSQIRAAGVGDFYQGALGRRIEQVSRSVGAPILQSDLRQALPGLAAPAVVSFQGDNAAFLPPPADGGLAAAVAFRSLARNPADMDGANARGLGAAARWRAGGASAEAILAAADLPGGAMPPLPASTSFVAMDREGNAVACALSMNNLFGVGRMLPGLGFIPAASTAVVPAPLLAAGLVWNEGKQAFRAAAGGSGQSGAPMAVAVGLMNALRSRQPMAQPVPEPGRANVIACDGYLPGNADSCAWATDPREPGLAVGGG